MSHRAIQHFAMSVAAVVIFFKGSAGANPQEKQAPKTASSLPSTNAVEVRYIDDSKMKIELMEDRVELDTPYGKLQIPVAAIHEIELNSRLPADVSERIETAVADLGHEDANRRQAAVAQLATYKERAIPALRQAAQSPDAAVAKRAREVIDKIRENVGPERLETRAEDFVHTAESKIAGRITATAWKVNTFQFGVQRLRLADLHSVRTGKAAKKDEGGPALPDPGSLQMMQTEVGKTYRFNVTGAQVGGAAFGGGGGFIWGTDVYTTDSTLAMAAVHAGVLKPGQTGVVKVTVLPGQGAYEGSNRNGIMSAPYGPFPGSFSFAK